jgi:hypothetical protein
MKMISDAKLLISRPVAMLTFIVFFLLAANNSNAGIIHWTDWQTSNDVFADGQSFNATGTITTSTTSINVTYVNPNGVYFFQDGVNGDLTDYFAQGDGPGGTSFRDPSRSPYTSQFVENIPTAAEMIGLAYQGHQTLTFSEAIANPVFSYVSLNGNGYAFDRDFEILSFGDGTENDRGYWGIGTSYKEVVDLGGGNFEYRLLGTGEPHGSIRFVGKLSTLTWRSMSAEIWNGFTVGVQGTAGEVYPVPEPTSLGIFGAIGLLSVVFRRRFRVRRTI